MFWLQIIYPFICGFANRLRGSGCMDKWERFKRVPKYIAYALMCFPIIFLVASAVQFTPEGVFSVAIVSLALIGGNVLRYQIADSRDFPWGLDNLYSKTDLPTIEFNWLVKILYKDKAVANQTEETRCIYKAVSLSLNKMVIGAPLYIGLAAALSLIAASVGKDYEYVALLSLAGIPLQLVIGAIYYYAYKFCDRKKKITIVGGHTLAEITAGLYNGVVDSFVVIGAVLYVFY